MVLAPFQRVTGLLQHIACLLGAELHTVYQQIRQPFQTASGNPAVELCHQRVQLVPRLGAKAFEQCAGFLRIPGASDPLDASAVHPESYPVVGRMASDLGVRVADLLSSAELRAKIDLQRYVTERTGLPTLRDILSELARPGLDPRGEARIFEFADVHSIDGLREGMVLPGIVTNVAAFGAFVDIGIKQDGLVHVSELSDRYVASPSDAVRLRQQVRVRVVSVDRRRGRIGLSMRGLDG